MSFLVGAVVMRPQYPDYEGDVFCRCLNFAPLSKVSSGQAPSFSYGVHDGLYLILEAFSEMTAEN